MIRNLFLTYILAALGVFFGTLLPWVTYRHISVNGSETDDGLLAFLIAAVLVIVAILAHANRLVAARIVGVLSCLAALALGVYEVAHINNDSPYSVGLGIWVMLIAALCGLVMSFLPTRTTVRV